MAASASQVTHSAEGEHLRSVFVGGDVTHGLALCAHRAALRSQVAVGIDLELDTTVAENSLGHYSDHIDARNF